MTATFQSVRNAGLEIRACSDIDVGEVRAVRSGIRDSNDLIWIGKAASFSAKLSDVRDAGYQTRISSRVHAAPNAAAKRDEQGRSRWTAATFDFAGVTETVYKTNHWKKP